MDQPARFSILPEATWPRLRALLDVHAPGGPSINMSIGEPQHDFPSFIKDIITENLGDFRRYPNNVGTPELLDAIQGWLAKRYRATVTPENILTLNGTREGLFNAALALAPEYKNGKQPVVLAPNPFYPAYSAAAAAVGAEAVFVPASAETGHLPDYAALPDDILDRTTIVYACSPANPQGAMADQVYWERLIQLAEKHDFYIFADECYSEIYRAAAPVGALEVAQDIGCDLERVMIFHSLSKRSNLAGLRSGFCAGGVKSIARMRQLRAYAGTPLPLPVQAASVAAWQDEQHVIENRALYQAKYAVADDVFANLPGYLSPQAGFFLWLPVEDGETAARKIWIETGVRTLPGAYLARDYEGKNPAKGFLRVAMVAPKEDVAEGLQKIRHCIYG